MTDGLHSVLRATAQHLVEPSSSSALPAPIASQIDITLHKYPSISPTLSQLKQVASEALDMAALIHLPAELFLSENEWAGARWKEERAKKAEEENTQALGFGQPDGQGASEYLAFAIKTHQEAQAQGESGYTRDEPEVLQYVLDHVADIILDLEARRQDGTLKLKLGLKDGEDARLRELRLNLLALAKRAPLDKIQRLPAELIPEHIRHYVPTVASSLSL